MKKITSILTCLLSALLVSLSLSSCFEDKEEAVPTERCYIYEFTLGSVKRTLHTTSSTGADSVYTVTVAGNSCPMSIDQQRHIIENKDSLPYGSQVNAVLTTVGFSSILMYKQADDEEWHNYSTSDSIDFTKPVVFKVLSSSAKSERDYTVKVNVHQQDGDKFCWERFDDPSAEKELAGLKERRMTIVGNYLYLLGRTSSGDVKCGVLVRSLPINWGIVESKSNLDGADLSTLCTYGDHMLMSNAKGEILQSWNGMDWSVLSEAVPGRRLLGTSKFAIYTCRNGVVECTHDGGLTWTENALDDEASYLPDSDITLLQLQQESGYNRLVMMGNRAGQGDLRAEVWSKAWREGAPEMRASWMYYPHTADNRVMCPQLDPLFVLPYDGKMIALGGKSLNGQYAALDKILVSPDYGLTWRASTELTTPEELRGTKDAVTIASDTDNFIWILAGEQLWRGRLTRLGFEKK